VLWPQDVTDLAFFQQKFPGNSLVYDLEQKDMVIKMSKGKPVVILKYHSSRIILQDNAGSMSNYKYYFSSSLLPKDIVAYSLVPKGSSYTKIPVKDFVKTAEFGDGNYFDDVAAYNFNFNSIEKGTKLVVESETAIADPYYISVFWFGRYLPVGKARLTMSYPSDVKIIYRMFGGADTSLIKFTSEKKGKTNNYNWEVEGLKGYDHDNVAPDDHYYTPHIIIQIAGYELDGKYIPVLGTIADLYGYLYKNLRDTISPETGPIKTLGDSLTSGIDQPEAKVKAIYHWVQNKIRYIAIEDGENGQVPCSPDLVVERRYGDCKGKTSLLVSLLRSQHIKASYAWIGTRELPYRFSEFPTRAGSNHMVAVWWKDDDTPVILDGTTQFHSLYEAPASIQGKECIIEKGARDYLVYTIPVAPPSSNTCTDSVSVSVENNTLSGTGLASLNGERKSGLLHSFNRVDTALYKNIVVSELPKASNKFIVTKVNTSSLSETEKPLVINYSFSIPDYVTEGNNKIYINMNLDKFPGNLTLEDDRILPVESEQTFNNIFTCRLKLPKSYIPEKIPPDASYSDPDFGFIQHYELKGDILTLVTRVYIGFQVINGQKVKEFSTMLSALRRAYSKSIVLIKN
jgi:hypothetical protein